MAWQYDLQAVTIQLDGVDALWKNSPDVAKTMLAQADESARDGTTLPLHFEPR